MTMILNMGVETRVNTYTTSNQIAPETTALNGGGYIVTWASNGQDGSGYGIYAQRYDALGHKAGGEFRVNTTVYLDQTSQHVTGLDDGGFVITWDSSQNGSDADIYAQRYDASGVKVGGEVRINTTTSGSQYDPAVTGLTDGGMVITWTTMDASFNHVIMSQRYDASGMAVGGEVLVNAFANVDHVGSETTALRDGGYVVTWQSQGQDDGGSSAGIYGRQFDAGGGVVGAEFLVNTTVSGDQSFANVTALGDGGYIVVWEDNFQDGSGYGIFSQRYNASGVAQGGETLVNATTLGNQQHPAVASLSDGGYVVVWNSENIDGSGSAIVGQVYDDQGDPLGGEFQINNYTAGNQYLPTVTSLSGGGFTVSWQSGQDGDGSGIYSKTFSAATSLSGTQILYGTADSDVLDGGSGADHMYGGMGDDTYVVNSAGDTISETVDGGIDLVQSSVSITLGANVENLTMTGSGNTTGDGNELNNTIFGNIGYNTLNGHAGDDTIDGGAGDDTISGGDGTDELYGGDGWDVISGDAGDDDINGGAGNDQLYGGTGDDTLDAGSGNDQVFGEDGNDTLIGGAGSDSMNGGAGNDKIYGGDQDDFIFASTGLDRVYGDGGTDTYDASSLGIAATIDLLHGKVTQGAGNITYLDSIENATGGGLDDTIFGSNGNNVLDGGAGADKLSGGLGDDTYIVDNIGDKVVESADATSGGTDEVLSSVSFILPTYVENLTLTGSANIDGTGNAQDNIITGNSGNNVLDGKAGNDTLIGGAGDDTYVVDVVTDVIVETPGQGTDTVKAAFSYVLGDNLENLTLTATANVNGTGNAANNTVIGNAGNNILDGGAGADIMTGGLGDDTYIVDNVGDVVNDYSGGGNDTILSSVSYTLSGRYVETLQLTGTGNINAIGNSQDNKFISNNGNNSLSGGTGADTFVFLLGSHADIITDFKATENDTIDVSAYHALAHTVTQSGTSVIIDFGSGNTVTVLKTTIADVNAHTIF